MKRILWIVIALVIPAFPAWGQLSNPSIVSVSGIPSSCGTLPLKIVQNTANLYGSNGSGGCIEISGGGSPSGPTFPVSPVTGQTFLLTSSALEPAGTYQWNGTKWINQSMPNMGIVRFTVDSYPAYQNVFEPVWSDFLYDQTFSFNNASTSGQLYTATRGLKQQNFFFVNGAIYAANPTSGSEGSNCHVGEQFSLNPGAGGGQNTLGVITEVDGSNKVVTVSFSPQDGGNPDSFWTVQSAVDATTLNGGTCAGLQVDITQVGPYALGILVPSGTSGYLALADESSMQYLNLGSSRLTALDVSDFPHLILFDVGNSQLTSVNLDATAMLYPQLTNNKLSSASINAILAKLVAAGLSNGEADLDTQTPPAPATGQGLIDEETLNDRGWQINVDRTGYTITAVNQGTKTFTVAGDRTGTFPATSTATVAGSTGNDGNYTVVSSTFLGGNTNIVVVEAIPNATADGTITDL